MIVVDVIVILIKVNSVMGKGKLIVWFNIWFFCDFVKWVKLGIFKVMVV